MKETAIFVAFFLLVTSTLIAVPVPLFPGNMVPTLLGIPPAEHIIYLEALTNGLIYSLIIGATFFLLVNKTEDSLSADSKRMTR